ncbi:MAG: hypothetical protein COZ59_10525 [Bacteroidetes bacterium CG_4_8_14_3_um_filter_31_14]|nr:MAG: hypothetical protein COZ59_10525 [Bacteroidetes bacterium CG_4_8_14_3_um_filter_31_14]
MLHEFYLIVAKITEVSCKHVREKRKNKKNKILSCIFVCLRLIKKQHNYIKLPNKKKHIKPLLLKDWSGYNPKPGSIQFGKKHSYFIQKGYSITGDAPKDFIRFYHYGKGRKANYRTWNLFIAKLGHKHYPIESITEQLITRIGEEYGFKMANSELAWLGGQIRFLSKYFITDKNDQVLEHGADLYAGFLNDKEFVEKIEKKGKSPEFFTVEFTEKVLKHFFKENSKTIFNEFCNMLLFDSLIGNNDRHFYNWGIVRSISKKNEPYFSPIYDTARGLFWNDHEDKILRNFCILSKDKGENLIF